MRKSKLNMVKRFPAILGTVLLFLTVFSCKSPSRAFPVRPTELLDSGNDLIISVPKEADPEFMKSVILEFSGDVSESDVQKLLKRVEKVYCGITEGKKSYSLEGVVLCNVPKSFASSIFTSKRGFSKLLYEKNNEKFEIYNQKNLNFVFPESNLLCLTQNKDLPTVIDKYISLRDTGVDPSETEEPSPYFDYETFLESAEDEIRFYSSKPLSLLSMISGFSKFPGNFSLIYGSGSLKANPENPESFISEIDLCFENPSFVKAGKVILGFALAFSDYEISIDNENPSVLSIKGLEINKQQIYRIILN